MLKCVNWREGDKFLQVGNFVGYSGRLPGVFRTRMKQLEAIHRWLGEYFEAVAIVLQIPGGSEYEWIDEEEDEEGEDARELVRTADRDMVLSILAEALEQVDAKALIHQVPGAERYRPRKLPVELRLMLAQRDRNGVLNVVAQCLDRLMVVPNVDDEDRGLYEPIDPPPRWWRAPFTYLLSRIRRRR